MPHPRKEPPRPKGKAHEATPRPPASPAPWDPSSFRVEPKEGFARFQDFPLPPEILRGIADLGFQYCTPIQSAILPKTLAGVDAAGRAQTGTGKTAAFLITIFTRLMNEPRTGRRLGTPRALILAPTRELVLQIRKEAEEIGRHSRVTTLAVFGGMDYDRQQRALKEGVIDVVVATPGRLLDFKRKRCLHLDGVEILVIDEADRMLDMGFIPDVRTIVHSTPPKDRRQTLLFSATLTPDVTRLCAQWTRDPAIVEIEPEQVAAESVEQLVYIITEEQKYVVLYNLLKKQAAQPVLIFANRRDQARDLTDTLRSHGFPCALLSGDVSQDRRVKTLDDFKSGRLKVLVATDVAGRGLHVEGISHVVNYHLPHDPEDYVHRIGRTGRAGATGTSVSFASEDDAFFIPAIEKFLGMPLVCSYPDEDLLRPPPATARSRPRPTRRFPKAQGRGGPRRRPPRR